ncbi:hypothetical protein ACFFWD_13245 [Bradyrhizobium erythrophlei]|uniref:hypothetical protein n=1 Tax=Bradyrhizobium erythrophlei TaxID=1437360 RepID=UPI0035E70826
MKRLAPCAQVLEQLPDKHIELIDVRGDRKDVAAGPDDDSRRRFVASVFEQMVALDDRQNAVAMDALPCVAMTMHSVAAAGSSSPMILAELPGAHDDGADMQLSSSASVLLV